MKKRFLLLLIVLVAVVIIGIIVYPKPCDYTNFAWGEVHRECDCLGIKYDNSCETDLGGPCPDAGGGTACIGIVTGRR